MIREDTMLVTMTVADLHRVVADEVSKAVGPMLQEMLTLMREGRDPDDDIVTGAKAIAKRLHVSEETLSQMVKAGELDGVVHKHRNTYVASKTALARHLVRI